MDEITKKDCRVKAAEALERAGKYIAKSGSSNANPDSLRWAEKELQLADRWMALYPMAKTNAPSVAAP